MSEEVSNAVEVKFFAKVSQIPIVNTAVSFASDRYNGLKNHNSLFRFAFNKAEQVVSLVASTAKPMVEAFGNTVTLADNFACQGLKKFEEVVPASKMTAEEMYTAGREKYGTLKEVGNAKIQQLKDYGTKKVEAVFATTYGSVVLKSYEVMKTSTIKEMSLIAAQQLYTGAELAKNVTLNKLSPFIPLLKKYTKNEEN